MKADFYLDEFGDQLGKEAWLLDYALYYKEESYKAWIFDLRGTQVAVFGANLEKAMEVIEHWADNSNRGHLRGITNEFIQKWHKAVAQGDLGPEADELSFVNLGRPIITIEGDCE